eukprot:scaffold19434_cov114-Isochrysis_galbana.AAC.2
MSDTCVAVSWPSSDPKYPPPRAAAWRRASLPDVARSLYAAASAASNSACFCGVKSTSTGHGTAILGERSVEVGLLLPCHCSLERVGPIVAAPARRSQVPCLAGGLHGAAPRRSQGRIKRGLLLRCERPVPRDRPVVATGSCQGCVDLDADHPPFRCERSFECHPLQRRRLRLERARPDVSAGLGHRRIHPPAPDAPLRGQRGLKVRLLLLRHVFREWIRPIVAGAARCRQVARVHPGVGSALPRYGQRRTVRCLLRRRQLRLQRGRPVVPAGPRDGRIRLGARRPPTLDERGIVRCLLRRRQLHVQRGRPVVPAGPRHGRIHLGAPEGPVRGERGVKRGLLLLRDILFKRIGPIVPGSARRSKVPRVDRRQPPAGPRRCERRIERCPLLQRELLLQGARTVVVAAVPRHRRINLGAPEPPLGPERVVELGALPGRRSRRKRIRLIVPSPTRCRNVARAHARPGDQAQLRGEGRLVLGRLLGLQLLLHGAWAVVAARLGHGRVALAAAAGPLLEDREVECLLLGRSQRRGHRAPPPIAAGTRLGGPPQAHNLAQRHGPHAGALRGKEPDGLDGHNRLQSLRQGGIPAQPLLHAHFDVERHAQVVELGAASRGGGAGRRRQVARHQQLVRAAGVRGDQSGGFLQDEPGHAVRHLAAQDQHAAPAAAPQLVPHLPGDVRHVRLAVRAVLGAAQRGEEVALARELVGAPAARPRHLVVGRPAKGVHRQVEDVGKHLVARTADGRPHRPLEERRRRVSGMAIRVMVADARAVPGRKVPHKDERVQPGGERLAQDRRVQDAAGEAEEERGVGQVREHCARPLPFNARDARAHAVIGVREAQRERRHQLAQVVALDVGEQHGAHRPDGVHAREAGGRGGGGGRAAIPEGH